MNDPDGAEVQGEAEAFRRLERRLHTHAVPPYQACDRICGGGCLARHTVADLIESGEQAAAWRRADIEDPIAGDGRRQRSWQVALDAAYSIIEFPEDDWPAPLRRTVSQAARRTALCFTQQMLDADPLKSPRTSRRILERLLAEAER